MSEKTRQLKETHEGAMNIINATTTVSYLSYEEAIAIYLRLRGILQDGAEILGSPIPADWKPAATQH